MCQPCTIDALNKVATRAIPMHTDQLTELFSLKRLFEFCAQRACTHLGAMSVRIEQRMVITFDKKRGGSDVWIVPTERVDTVVGATFVTLGYCGDRGFAKFCDGDASKPNPLSCYTWLETLQRHRNNSTSVELNKIATETRKLSASDALRSGSDSVA